MNSGRGDPGLIANSDPAGSQFIHVWVTPDGSKFQQQFPPYGFSSEKTLVLISHFANPSRKMLLWTSHLNTWTDGVARHGACSR